MKQVYSLRKGYFADNPQCVDSPLPIEHLRGLGVRGGMFEMLTRLLIRIQSKLVRKTREHANTKHNRCLNNRRQHAGSQTLLKNGEVKRKHILTDRAEKRNSTSQVSGL